MLSDVTILIADGNRQRRESLAETLQNHSYILLQADDGQDVLDISFSDHVDLIILTADLPRRDGFSVCRTLKENADTAFIPVILLTETGSTRDRLFALEVGAYSALSLPSDAAELLPQIGSLARTKRMIDEMEHAESVAMSFALGIDANDSYTAGHSQRVAQGSLKLAERLPRSVVEIAMGVGRRIGLEPDKMTILRRAALVHDVGKIGIPTDVIRKAGKLSSTERSLIELHPVIGERICKPLKSFSVALPIIRHHHEKLDGTGYPDGLTGAQIPLLTRIVSIADVYDALTSARSYRSSLSRDSALTLIREEAKRGWWDSDLVEEFSVVTVSP